MTLGVIKRKFFDNLHQLIEEQEYEKLQEKLNEMEEVEAADFLSEVDIDDALLILNRLENEFRAEIFANFQSQRTAQ